MKKKLIVFLLVFSFLIFTSNVVTQAVYADDFTILHEFAGVAGDDGREPYGSLIRDGTTLYGMTYWGGTGNGVVFSMETDGSGFILLHEFSGFPDGGRTPFSSLIQGGDTLYGMTYTGGENNKGVIFSIGTDGSGFSLLHEFAGGIADGSYPYYSSLILDGTILYGMALTGGANDYGVIFSIDTDGNNFTILHDGSVADGYNPYGSLIQDGTTLYGMVWSGGSNGDGVIFSMDTDGNDFTLLHEFGGGVDDGENPWGSLIQDGDTLYGMTKQGGENNKGVIFSIGTDGSGFSLLHEFGGGVDDGEDSRADLIRHGNTLCGMTVAGGDNNKGVIFSIGMDGSDFTLLHEFAGGVDDGEDPRGSLIHDGNNLYGMTRLGGDDDYGVVFSFVLPPLPEEEHDKDEPTPCFLETVMGIASAKDGEDKVIALRRFRDKNLLSNPLGKVFVATYYEVSPVMEGIINKYPVLKNFVREILKPVTWLCKELVE